MGCGVMGWNVESEVMGSGVMGSLVMGSVVMGSAVMGSVGMGSVTDGINGINSYGIRTVILDYKYLQLIL